MPTIKVGNINGQNFSAVDDDSITITHEASMTSYDKLYAVIDFSTAYTNLVCDQGNGASTVNAVQLVSGSFFPVSGYRFGTKTITVYHDASASSNGSLIYGRPNGYRAIQIFSTTLNNQSNGFQDSEGANGTFIVLDDDNASEGSVAIEVDTGDDTFQMNTNGFEFYLISDGLRKYKVKSGSSGTAVYYDHSNTRLIANFGNTTDHTIDSTTTSLWPSTYPFDERKQGILNVYFDEDAAVGNKLLHDFAYAPTDLLVLMAGTRFVKLKYDASASSNGVAVYLDQGSPFSTLKFTSPTTTNGTLETHQDYAPVQNIVIKP